MEAEVEGETSWIVYSQQMKHAFDLCDICIIAYLYHSILRADLNLHPNFSGSCPTFISYFNISQIENWGFILSDAF